MCKFHEIEITNFLPASLFWFDEIEITNLLPAANVAINAFQHQI